MKLRKIICLLLTFSVLISTAGCGKSKSGNTENNVAVNKLEDVSSKEVLTGKNTNVENGEDKDSYQNKNEAGSEKSAEDIETVKITIVNNLGYDIEVGHISPIEKDSWGEVVFGDAKNGFSGKVEMTLLSGSDTYDILITDTDKDNYLFNGIVIKDGYRLEFYWEENIKVEVYNNQRLLATTYGEFDSNGDFEENYGTDEQMPTNITGAATQGKVEFKIYNESPYEIYNVYFGPNDANIEDIDVLGPEDILTPDLYLYSYSTTLPREQWDNIEWTLFVVDADGDTSFEYKVCNPYALNYVDIKWDSENWGYIINCFYKTTV